jgi:membrane fusion protein, multidrug efflux system
MRYLYAIGILLVVTGGLAGLKFAQISTLIRFGEAAKKSGPPPETVGTTIAKEDQWEGTLSAVGTVVAVRGVTISNEAPGVVTAIHFESGQVVGAGRTLVELDTSVERAQLASAQARKELAALSQGRSQILVQREAASKAQLDGDDAQVRTSSADYSALVAQIDKKTIRAPFAGKLGIRTVNLGQYLNPGTPLTTLESLGSVYADFTLPQESLGEIKTGMPVQVTLTDGGGYAGAIAAVDPSIDPVTRTIKLRAGIPNQGEKLRPGMFVRVTVLKGENSKVTIAPLTAVVHASYGDSVFVVEAKDGHKIARQQFVRLGTTRGDFVAIADGVKAGQELVTEGAFKLRNGSGVVINNEIKPPASTSPTLPNL